MLKHELTHSFIQQKTHGRAPDVAPGRIGAMDGREAQRRQCSVLVQVYDEKQAMRLSQLEGSWMQLSGPMRRLRVCVGARQY